MSNTANQTKQIIQYWHNSLSDAELAFINLSRTPHYKIPLTDTRSGQLDAVTVRSLFEDRSSSNDNEDDEDSYLQVIVAPIVAKIKYSHGQQKRHRTQNTICPLLIPANLDTKGILRPINESSRPWIPRNLLEPTSNNLVFGNIKQFDKFLTDNELNLTDNPVADWKTLYTYGWNILNYVSDQTWKSILDEADYKNQNYAIILESDSLRGYSTNILRVYDHLLDSDDLGPLLQTYVDLNPPRPRKPILIEQWSGLTKKHLGSFNNQFPLSPSQRQALYHFLALPENSFLAVSGPPGTGKTTLLHSVIASMWVDAAIHENSPPVVVAASTNNQAVMNVIDSLSGLGILERWIPISSYGLFLVNSPTRQEEARNRGILSVDKMGTGFPNSIENETFFRKAKEEYLDRCTEYFDREISSVDSAIESLLAQLLLTTSTMQQGIERAYSVIGFSESLAEIRKGYGGIDQAKQVAKRKLEEAKASFEEIKKIETAWLRHMSQKPISQSVLGFLPGIKQKQKYRNRIFINDYLPNIRLKPDDFVIQAKIDEIMKRRTNDARNAQQSLDDINVLESQFQNAQSQWLAWCNQFADGKPDVDHLFTLENAYGEALETNLLNWLDTTYRYQQFELATHYWEGRWLREVENIGLTKPGFKERQNRKTQELRWQRYAMLTPCFVTTMHSGPSFFDYYDGQSKPLDNFIDLLIVDEAGQVTPEVSGAMIALSRKALVVGDVLQIEPVWNIPEQIDQANLARQNLLANDSDLELLRNKGIRASDGSLMKMAQSVSPYQIPNRNGEAYERGMFLTEHRRCVPEIINYCNELAYGGRLKPKRRSLPNHPWPHIGYVHVKGQSSLSNGSRHNKREALALTSWIVDNKEQLEQHYGCELDDIVGIVTPFVAQKRIILLYLDSQGISISKTGTIHALQGGERTIVLFSSVYAKSDPGGYFFDLGPNMLNVAVSRAKDSFIVFGDMDIFDPELSTPSGLLARFLYSSEENEIVRAVTTERLEATGQQEVYHVSTLDMHIRTLARAFERAEERLIIVSPYLRWRAVEADGICEKVADTVARGVQVKIYIDSGFNENLTLTSAAKAAEELSSSGAKVTLCHNIHSKILCIDEDVFVEGSFNWLSAERIIDHYTRYETSIIYIGSLASDFIMQTSIEIEKIAAH